MTRILATALAASLLAIAAAPSEAMPIAPVTAPSSVEQVRRRLRQGVAPRSLWRVPSQLREPRRARLPARLSHRPGRPLPRQRQIAARATSAGDL
jgi:hypothetical protein